MSDPIFLFKAPVPPQWTTFLKRYPEEWPEYDGKISDLDWPKFWTYTDDPQIIYRLTDLINGIGYVSDGDTDVWNVVYSLRPRGGFDCDDRTLTLASMIATEVGNYRGLMPMLCLNEKRVAHMALMVRFRRPNDWPDAGKVDYLVSDYNGAPDWDTWKGQPLAAFNGRGWQYVFREAG